MSASSEQFGWLSEASCRKRSSLKWSRFGSAVLPLDVGEFDCKVSECVVDAIARKAQSNDLGYSPTRDNSELCDLVLKRYQKSGIHIAPSNLHFSGGQLYAVSEIIRLLDVDRKKVIVLGPVYPGLLDAIIAGGGWPEIINLQVSADGILVDFEAIEAVCDKGHGALVTTFPHVPTGATFTAQEAIKFANLASRMEMKVVIDGVYIPLLEQEEMAFLRNLFEQSDDAVLIETVTKSWGISSIRGAWIVFSSCGLSDTYRISSLPRICPPTALFESVASVCLTVGLNWLDEARVALKKNVLEAEDRLSSVLNSESMYCFGSMPFVWINLAALGYTQSRPCLGVLRRAKVSLDGGSEYGAGWESFGRMNIACHPDVLHKAIDRVMQT